MEAKTQYNDFKGTVAADISDYYLNSMDEYLFSKSKNYDKNRYKCIGCEFMLFGIDKLDAVFYCRDLKDGSVVPIRLITEFTLAELFVMFKRFAIVVGQKIENVDEPQREPIYLD